MYGVVTGFCGVLRGFVVLSGVLHIDTLMHIYFIDDWNQCNEFSSHSFIDLVRPAHSDLV
jgi:hypothetical protein